MDDLLVLGTTPEEVRRSVKLLITELLDAGITPNLPKSHLTPTQEIPYLGFTLQLLHDGAWLACPTEKRGQVRRDLARLLRSPTVTPRRLASVLGRLRALKPAWPTANLDTLEVSKALSTMLRQHGWTSPHLFPPLPSPACTKLSNGSTASSARL